MAKRKKKIAGTKRKTTKRKTTKKTTKRKGSTKNKTAKKGAKTTKKRAVKKKPKSTVSVTVTRKVLGKAPEEYHFVLHDGRKLESVYQLIDELEIMTEDAFKNYVNQAENHFANWLDHVFHEKHLADQLRKIQNKAETQKKLLKHMVRELIHEMKKK